MSPILEVVDELPLGATGRNGRPIAPDVAAVLAGLPDYPKWAVVCVCADAAERKATADRFSKLAKRVGIQVHNSPGTGRVYVRRKAPAETATLVPFTRDAPDDAPTRDQAKELVEQPPVKPGPGRPPKTPARGPDPVVVRPRVIGWLGKPRAERMDLFLDAWRAHAGKAPAVAAELDISTALVDQWRRDAKTEGRIR